MKKIIEFLKTHDDIEMLMVGSVLGLVALFYVVAIIEILT
jgi:hypothetical protein